MSLAPDRIEPPQRILMGPGPSDVPASVLQAMAAPTIGHLDPDFLRIMDELSAILRELFATSNALTLAISGTGSSGMETCFVNLLEPGDDVLVGINGVFGTRMKDVAERCGAQVTVADQDWGRAFDVEQRRISKFRSNRVQFVTPTNYQASITKLAGNLAHYGAAFIDVLNSLT